ncbi:hypothetical protein [Algoriphagus sp. AK58]|uniref:hypothetical protein n=1 Tax=Algoriphagus sp. AK58 TaxID=1406877 RepID=UPI0016507691|nr:hypothetical protein [Algoriphagus sp. AK58]MBC6369163.1 hypothetical protein [Algoriphagus sp. AK58]
MKSRIITCLILFSLFSCIKKDSLTRFKIKIIDQNIPSRYSNVFIVVTGYKNIGFPNSKIESVDTIKNNVNESFEFSLNNPEVDQYSITLIDSSAPSNQAIINIDNLNCQPYECSQPFFVGKKYEFDIIILP